MAFCLIWFPKRKRYFMDFFNALIHNTVFMSAVTGWFAAQVTKTVIYTCITKSFDPERLVGSGGMPSSHSATVCALANRAPTNCLMCMFCSTATCIFPMSMLSAMNWKRRSGRNWGRSISLFIRNRSVIISRKARNGNTRNPRA